MLPAAIGSSCATHNAKCPLHYVRVDRTRTPSCTQSFALRSHAYHIHTSLCLQIHMYAHTNMDAWGRGGTTPGPMRPGAQTQQPEIQANQSSASNHTLQSPPPPQLPSTLQRQPRLYFCGHLETTIHSWLSHITQTKRVELSPSRCVMEQAVGDQRDWTSSESLRRQIWS